MLPLYRINIVRFILFIWEEGVEAPWLTSVYIRQQAFHAHSQTFRLLPEVLAERAK